MKKIAAEEAKYHDGLNIRQMTLSIASLQQRAIKTIKAVPVVARLPSTNPINPVSFEPMNILMLTNTCQSILFTHDLNVSMNTSSYQRVRGNI